jgi:hypothetical protein
VLSSTLQGAYDAGSSAADQTQSIASAKGGPILVKAAGAATGSLWKALTSAAATLVDFTDNAAQTIKSAIADGAGAVAHITGTTNTLADATAIIESWRNGVTERMALYASGKLIAGGVVLTNHATGLPSDVIHSSTADGYMALMADGVGSTYGGTGLIAHASAGTPTSSSIRVAVNDALQAIIGPGYFELFKMLAFPSVVGSPLSVTSNTIAPTQLLHFLSAPALIKTITPPFAGPGFVFWLIPASGAAFSWDTTGNIINAGISGVNRPVCFQYSGSSWFASYVMGDDVGAALTVSSNTIAPVNRIHSVGAGLIKTISLPFTAFTGSIILRPTAAFTWDATGNILGSGTATIGRDLVATYDGTSWAISAAGGVGDVTLTGVEELTNKTLTAQVVKTGLTASGSASNNFGGSTGPFVTSSGANTLSGDTTVADTKTLTTSNNSITTGQTVAISAQNTTVASASNQKYGPMIESAGQGWKTTATAASQLAAVGFQARPIEGTTAPSVAIDFFTRIGASAAVKLFSMRNAGSQSTFESVLGDVFFGNNSLDGVHVTTSGTYIRNGADYWKFLTTALTAAGDVTNTIGSTSVRFLSMWSAVYAGIQTNSTSSGAISITAATAGQVFNLVPTANVTSITLTDGVAGQEITLVLKQDAAAAYTWPSVVANARLAGGTFTKTTTANAVDTLTLRWDSSLSDWVETSRAIALT